MVLVLKKMVKYNDLNNYSIMLDVVSGSIILSDDFDAQSSPDIFCFTNHTPLLVYQEHHLTDDVIDYIKSKYFNIVAFYESERTQADWEYIFDDINEVITPYKGLSLDDVIADYVTLPWRCLGPPSMELPIVIEYDGYYELCIDENTDEHVIYNFAEKLYNDLNDHYVIDFYASELHNEFMGLQDELIRWIGTRNG